MPRAVLDEDHIHPDARERVAWPKEARRVLDAAGLAYKYLEYGSYLSEWRKRLAIKMWTGWPTYPMVFVKGVLIGGAAELERFLQRRSP